MVVIDEIEQSGIGLIVLYVIQALRTAKINVPAEQKYATKYECGGGRFRQCHCAAVRSSTCTTQWSVCSLLAMHKKNCYYIVVRNNCLLRQFTESISMPTSGFELSGGNIAQKLSVFCFLLKPFSPSNECAHWKGRGRCGSWQMHTERMP